MKIVRDGFLHGGRLSPCGIERLPPKGTRFRFEVCGSKSRGDRQAWGPLLRGLRAHGDGHRTETLVLTPGDGHRRVVTSPDDRP